MVKYQALHVIKCQTQEMLAHLYRPTSNGLTKNCMRRTSGIHEANPTTGLSLDGVNNIGLSSLHYCCFIFETVTQHDNTNNF